MQIMSDLVKNESYLLLYIAWLLSMLKFRCLVVNILWDAFCSCFCYYLLYAGIVFWEYLFAECSKTKALESISLLFA